MARARSAGAAALSHGGPEPPKQGLVRRLELSRSPAGCHGGKSGYDGKVYVMCILPQSKEFFKHQTMCQRAGWGWKGLGG